LFIIKAKILYLIDVVFLLLTTLILFVDLIFMIDKKQFFQVFK